MTMPLSPPCHYRRAYKNDGPCPPVSKNPEGTGGGTVMAWGHQKMDQWCHITTRVVYVIGYTHYTQTPGVLTLMSCAPLGATLDYTTVGTGG
jgi:hypothetical protein